MRKTWFAVCTAVAMTAGCAGPASPAKSGGIAANAGPGAAQQASWTQRITAPFTTNPFTAFSGMAKPAAKTPKIEPAEKPFDPDKATPELYVRMAQLSHRGGDVSQARTLYQKALVRDPKHLEALMGAARMEDREGQLDVALMLYKRAAEAHPRNATAVNDLALCFARRGDLATAHQVLEQAVRLEPGKPLYRNNVAKVLVEMNRLDQATGHLSAVHPPAVANYNMAVLLSERGRTGDALNYLTAALAIDPRMPPAQAMLAQLTAPPQGSADYSIVQTTPADGHAAQAGNDSILPTPEVVATVPWTAASPAQQSEQSPMLLPPVN